jgi:hypothetical protein
MAALCGDNTTPCEGDTDCADGDTCGGETHCSPQYMTLDYCNVDLVHIIDPPDGVATQCGPSEFQCFDGTCNPAGFICDGFDDCVTGEDELGC